MLIDPYNLPMLKDLLTPLVTPIGAAAMARLSLLLNHVIAAESVAVERLKPHAGRSVQLFCTGWPTLLPALPMLAFTITAAGLLEWAGAHPPAEPALRVSMDVSNPAQLLGQCLSGERPHVNIEGDAALATDVGWLIENLRWDIEDDLAQIMGPTVAHQLARLGRGVGRGFGSALRALQSLASRRGGGAFP
jgi:ubiquinone biosynthesis accessory factor UbiJ